MLFNSYIFIFLFLPITLTGFFAIGKIGHHKIATSWLVGASLFFYGWWNPAYLGLIIGSILFNYGAGVAIRECNRKFQRKSIFIFGIVVNLGLLGYFKYANFFTDNLSSLTGYDFHLNTIILPLAISFFTFQQIAYLVDSYKLITKESDFLNYCLFVTFFPQLIAGPIVHHRELIPQFNNNYIYKFNITNISVGITIFTIGLFKKVVFADSISVYASSVFGAAEKGVDISIVEAWGGALAYTLQLYYDFSGYSDMAIGLSRVFGIKLPINFQSPYKAKNIIDFWQCWHITLSRFLKDYLYIPLGGNRRGKMMKALNLMITMTLGGLWHGAAWTYVIWGGLHGLYLVANHTWHDLRRDARQNLIKSSMLSNLIAWLITFHAIIIGWVIFRAESFGCASRIISVMYGGRDASFAPQSNLVDWQKGFAVIAVLLLIALIGPCTQQIMIKYNPTIDSYQHKIKAWGNGQIQFCTNNKWAIIVGIAFFYSTLHLADVSEFLYFQF